MKTKKQRAVYAAVAVGALLLSPVLYFRWLDAEGDPAAVDLGQVQEFLITDAQGAAMSRFDLDGNLTFVAWLGGVCADPAAVPCLRAKEQLEALSVWAEKRLLYADENEQSPVRLVVAVQKGLALPAAWRRVDLAADGSGDARALLPGGCAEQGAPLVVIDQSAHARRCFPLAGEEPWTDLKPLLSRMTINHYMHDYLAKRTFFRREPKKVDEAGATH